MPFAVGGLPTGPAMTAAGDLVVGGKSGTPARLAKGTDGQVLTVNPTTHLLGWATPAGASSPLTGAAVSGHVGGQVTYQDSTASVGGDAKLDGGNTQSDRRGGYVYARAGTSFYGAIEMGVGDGYSGTRPQMIWDGVSGLRFIHPGAVSFSNDAGDLTFSLTPYAGSTLFLNMTRLPTTDPHVVGRIWNNSGVMTVSAG